MKRLIWVVTGVVVAVSLVVAVLGLRSAQRARITASELANHNKQLDAEIAKSSQQLATRTHDSDEVLAALQQLQSRKGKTSPTAQPPRRDLADLMETNPALRTLFKQSFRANLGLQFGLLYDRACLSPEQIEKFEALMTEAEQDRLDLMATAKTQGLAANNPALAKMRQQADERLQSAQREVLGDAGYQELQRGNRQQPLQNFITSFASGVAYDGSPLNASQVGQLYDVLSNASSQYQSGGRAELTTIDPKRVRQQAEQILTPVQFAVFQANANIIELVKLRDQFYQQKKAAGK